MDTPEFTIRDATFYNFYTVNESLHAWVYGIPYHLCTFDHQVRYSRDFYDGLQGRPGFGYLFAEVQVASFYSDGRVFVTP